MMYAITTLLFAAAALAAPVELEPRACTYKYLPNLYSISQHVPEVPNGPFKTPFNVAQDIGKRDLVVRFNGIPSTAYGCQLEFNYQPNHNAIVEGIGPVQQMHVYAVKGPLPAKVTWETMASHTGNLIGTFNFPTGDALNTPQMIVMGNSVCKPNMLYRISIASDAAKGAVSDDVDSTSGLRLSYNC